MPKLREEPVTFHRWSYSQAFLDMMPYFTPDEKARVADFIVTYQDHGLNDFKHYKGKITRTGSGDCTQEEREYGLKHNLWHYHVGIPSYVPTPHGKYMTSRDVLHFQWFQAENRIRLVDMYRHYLLDGKFYVPPERALELVTVEVVKTKTEANDDAGDVPTAV